MGGMNGRGRVSLTAARVQRLVVGDAGAADPGVEGAEEEVSSLTVDCSAVHGAVMAKLAVDDGECGHQVEAELQMRLHL